MATATSVGAQGVPVSLHRFDIAPGPLGGALALLGEVAELRLLVPAELTRSVSTDGVRGTMSGEAALRELLVNTGLTYVFTGARTVTLVPAPPPPPSGKSVQVDMLREVQVVGSGDAKDVMYETPGAVSTITREEIDRLPPRNTSDMLVDVPGLFTSQARQNPGVSINMRGLQDFGRVNVMIDGTRQNFQQSGHGSNGAVYIDPELLGGVDISKGPNSTVGGAGMIAGMVNFRTLDFADLVSDGARAGGRVNATTGSNAYHFGGSVALGLKAADDVDMVFAVSRKSIGAFEKGKRGNAASDSPGSESLTHGTSLLSAQDQQSALLKGTWRFAPGHQLKLSYIGFDAKFDEGPAVRQESLAVTHNHIQTNTLLANYDWRPAGSTLLDLKSSVYYTRTRNQAQRGVGTLDTNEYQLQYQTSTVGGTLQNSARFSVPHADVLLKTGGEFFHDWTDPQAQSLSAGADAGTTALYAGATPAGKRTVASLFGEASLLHSDWLEVTGGLRYDWYGMNGSGRMRVGSITNPGGVRPGTTVVYSRFNVDRHDGAFSPKLSLAIKPVQPIQLFASIGQGMRPPALTEALLWGSHSGSLFPYYPNPNVRAERSTNWEVGANGIFRNLATRADSLRVKAAWFDSRVKNYITLGRIMSPISESGGGALGPYAYVNLDDPFRTRGLELQADYDAGTVFGGVSYTHSLIDTGKGGYNPFPLGSLVGYPANSLGAPADANIWYVLPPRKNLSLSGGVRLLERRLVLGARMRLQSPSANTSMWTSGGDKSYNQQSWRLFDLWASFEATRNTTVRLAVNNLRDTNYAEMQGSTYFVGPGRTVTATVSVKF